MTGTLVQGTEVVEGLPDTVYHADRTSLSSSGARLLLPPSTPAKFRWAMDHPRPAKKEFDFGHAAHRLVLDEGQEIHVVQADSWRTKAAQAQRDEAREGGMIPMLEAEYGQALAMRDSVMNHLVAGPLFTNGRAETSLYWTDDETGVRLRARPDWLTTIGGRPVAVDYKTAASANPDQWARKAYDFGYHLQTAYYLDGIRSCGLGDDAGFLFVITEKTPPFETIVAEMDPTAVRRGALDAREAIDLYAHCMAEDHWPGYADTGIVTITLPAWAE